MSGAATPPFTKDTVIPDGNIIVEDGAKKHPTEFAGGVVRKPTDGDIRTVFKANVKLADPPKQDRTGAWQWVDIGLDPSTRPARMRKRNNMCFKVRGGQYVVFHYHKGWYDE